MQESAKYLIHADIVANGVVERSDVVGAVFGQTEGLLGDELDLRGLQESSKVGRIDVEIQSESGQSFGTITIASGLDRVETAILAAALESIERVGPCRADVEVAELEDVRSAKRRQVVDRAKELLTEFDEAALTGDDLVDEVRQAVRVENIATFEGLPAGPRVADSDAVIVVEGRSDVLTLLKYGVKNAVAVEGTDVPDAIAELTRGKTVTAFLDGDRGGDLILKELGQVGEVDHVAFAPSGRSVEDLTRGEVMGALREKVPYDVVAGESDPSESEAVADGSVEAEDSNDPAETDTAGQPQSGTGSVRETAGEGETTPVGAVASQSAGDAETGTRAGTVTASSDGPGADLSRADDGEASDTVSADTPETDDDTTEEAATPATLPGHVEAVIGAESGQVRLLDDSLEAIGEESAGAAFETVVECDPVPATVVLDGELTQRLLDVLAQRGVDQVVAGAEGEFVKKPTSVRVRTASDF
jgi:DNA primase